MTILIGLSDLAGTDLHNESHDLIRRLQGRGAYSTDPDSARDQEILAWAEMHANAKNTLDILGSNILPDKASELLVEWESYLRIPNNAPRTDAERRIRTARFLSLVYRATRYNLLERIRQITSIGSKDIVRNLTYGNYYSIASPTHSGSSTMTRSVLFHYRSSDSLRVLCSCYNSGTGVGWVLQVTAAGVVQFVSSDGISTDVAVSPISLINDRYYCVTAAYDGDTRLAVNEDVFTESSTTLSAGTSAHTLGGFDSDNPAFGISILGYAVSDTTALSTAALRAQNLDSLDAGVVQAFTGAQARYLADSLETDVIGSEDFTVNGSPVATLVEYSSVSLHTPSRSIVSAHEANPESILHLTLLMSPTEYGDLASRNVFDYLERVLPQRTLGQISRPNLTDEQLVTYVGAEWADSTAYQKLGQVALANDTDNTQETRRNMARLRDYGPLSRLTAEDLNNIQEAFVFEGVAGDSQKEAAHESVYRFFAAEVTNGGATTIDTSVDWRDRTVTLYCRTSTSDIRPGQANDTDANDIGNEFTVHLYTKTGETGLPGGSGRAEALITSDNYIRSNTSGELEIYNDDSVPWYIVGCVVASGDLGEH